MKPVFYKFYNKTNAQHTIHNTFLSIVIEVNMYDAVLFELVLNTVNNEEKCMNEM